MMQRPWASGTIDEWLPRNLRLCWGSGDGGGGGFGGDSGGGGWGGDSGFSGATTGGGDWGSSGSYDASGMNAGGDTNAWAGTAYDASTSGTGAGGGGDWGSFGATNYSGMNAPNPTFADVAGPNPGVTTGGGDWGSAGAFSAAGTGGGPGGAMFGAAQGAAQGAGGGLWGDTGGGGGGGLTGGGGGGGGGGGKSGGSAAFGTFGSSNFGGEGGGKSYAGSPTASPGWAPAAAPGGKGSDPDAAPGGEGADPDADPGSQFGGPETPAADPGAAPSKSDAAPDADPSPSGTEAPSKSDAALSPDAGAAPSQGKSDAALAPEAAPSLSDAAPSGNIGGNYSVVGHATQTEATPEAEPSATSAFGPETLSGTDLAGDQGTSFTFGADWSQPGLAQSLGLNDISVGTGQGLNTNTGILGMNTGTLTQETGLGFGPGFAATGIQSDLGYDTITASPSNLQDVNWSAVFEAPTQTDEWGLVFEGAAPAYDPMDSPFTTPTSTDDTYTPGGDPALSGHPDDPSARSELFEGAPSNQNVDWGSVFEGAAGPEEAAPSIEAFIPGDRATDFDEPDWPSVFEGAPSNQNVNWAEVFEGAAPAPAPAPALPPISLDTVTVNPDTVTPDTLTPVTATQYNNAIDTFAALDAAAAAKNASDAAVFDAADQANQAKAGQPETESQQPSETTTSAFIPGGRPTDFNYQTQTQTQAPPPSLIEQAQSAPSTSAFISGSRPTDFNYTRSSTDPSLVETGRPGGIGSDRAADPDAQQPPGIAQDDDDAPEPPDTPPSQDPNAPRPPGNIPGQLIGARDNYPNDHLDNPRNPFYRDSGRTDYPQGRPGITYRTTRQAGVVPNFRVGDYNVHDLDARLIENLNRAIAEMERQGIPNTLEVSSAYRPSTRAESLERGMDPRTSQESVYARGHAPGGRPFPAGRPGGSNHAPGRAIDFNPALSGRALTWLRAHANEFGLETLGYRNGRIFDEPHIQLRGGRGNVGARPSAQEQQEQRAIDAQNRQAASGRQAAVPVPQARPRDAPQQPDVARPPADIPPPEVPAARPPVQDQAPAPAAPRPPADIPAPAPFLAPPARGTPGRGWQTDRANELLKQSTAHLNKDSGQADFEAAAVVGAKALAAAGIPLAMARGMMTKGAYEGAAKNGFDVNSWPMGGVYKSKIDNGIEAALQGYNPAATGPTPQGGRYGPGPVQGPQGFQPDAPAQQRSEAPFGQQFARELTRPPDPNAPPPDPNAPPPPPVRGGRVMQADASSFGGWPGVTLAAGGRDVGAPPVVEPDPLPGRAEGEAPLPGEAGSNLPGPLDYAVDPRTGELTGKVYNPDKNLPSRVIDPDIWQGQQLQQEQYQQNLDPRGQRQASLLDFLQNFNPISTAEAKGRGRDVALDRAIAQAREGGNFGGQPGMSVVGSKVFTFYAPGASGLHGMEGPMIGSKSNPLTTLDDVRNGAGFVSLAGHPSQFGQQVFIGNITYTSPIDGKQYTLNNVIGRVDDTGGKFMGKDNPDQNHFDIAVGDFSTGWNDNTAGKFVAGNYATAAPGRGVGSDYAASSPDDQAPAVAAQPPQEAPPRGLAKGGHVAKDETVVVGEEGPEYFVPDQPGTVWPHIPQPGKGKRDIDRWPKLPAVGYPGQYGGVEREMRRQTSAAQDPSPGLMDMIDSGRMRLNEANWQRMIGDPDLIALGRWRMEDRRDGSDTPAPSQNAAEVPPDPTNAMAQALGYGSIKRRPLRVGRQSY